MLHDDDFSWMDKKHLQTNKIFELEVAGVVRRVTPFNGEDENLGPSWSHGFTHFKDESGNYVGFCGTVYFDENAVEVQPKTFKFHKDGTLPVNGEIFVFGSNEAGIHGAGAALVAKQKFGAIQGKGLGAWGKSYAIPTKSIHITTLDKITIWGYVDEFIWYAWKRPEEEFFVTRVGCGLAGYSDHEIAPLFKKASSNCSFAEEWKPYLSA